MIIKFCKDCKEKTPHIIIPLDTGPHYGELRCEICDKFWGFEPKPINNGKRPRNKHTPQSLEIDNCQLCLRARCDLINTETLESHHIIEIQDSGPDTPENVWVLCTPCHRMVHYLRTYLRRSSGAYK